MFKFIRKVIEIGRERRTPWLNRYHGYDAIPFQKVIEALWIGLTLFLGGYALPDVSPSNDGTFSFEWYADMGDEIDFCYDPKKNEWFTFWVRGKDCYSGPLSFPMGKTIGNDERGWPVPTDTHLIVIPPRKQEDG